MSMRRHTFGIHVLTLTVAATGILAGCSSTSLSRAPIESRESNRGTTHTTRPAPRTHQHQHSTRPVIVDSNGNVINGSGQVYQGQTHGGGSHYPAGSTVQSYPVPTQNTTQNNTSGSLYPQGAVVSSGTTTNAVGATTNHQAMAGQPGYYTVRAGDNIYRIGLNHQQRWQDIAAWNNLPEPYTISIGQVLRVAPLPGEAPVATSTPVDATATSTTTTTTTEASTPTPATSTGTWQWPARGKVVGKFNGKNNKGINIAGKRGAAVVASRAGSVVYAGEGLRGYGKLIIVKHDNTFLTAYAHNSKLLVKENQKVAQGQKIAEMGDSDAKRVMLHFEVRKDGKPVNPMGYLK